MEGEDKVTIEIELVKPYNKSVTTIYNLVNAWGFELIKSGTEERYATIRMTVVKFAKMFHKIPQIGKIEVPGGASGFMESIKITKLEEYDEKH